MLAPLAAAVLPVALAILVAGLAGTTRGRQAGLLRALALGVAFAVVLGELLPDVAARLGAPALLLFLAGLWGPVAFEDLGNRLRALRPGGTGPGLLLGGLAAHQLVDGVAVGGAWAHGEGPAVAVAVAAHSIPLLTAALQAVAVRGDRRLTWGGGALLLVATALGVVAGQRGAVGVGLVQEWLPAFIAGLVLHVLGHDLHAGPARGAVGRWSELAVLLGGGAATLLLLDGEGRHAVHEAVEGPGYEALAAATAIELGPPVLLGLALLAWPAVSRRLPAALDPVAALVALALLGPGLAVPAVLLGGALAWLAAQDLAPAGAAPRDWATRQGPWLLAGAVGMALVRAFVAPLPGGVAVAIGGVVALASLVLPLRAVAAVPVLVALGEKGLPAWAVASSLVLVLAGCARHPLGPRLQGLAVAGLAAAGALLWPAGPTLGPLPVAGTAAAALVVALGLYTMGRVGPRRWLAALEIAAHAHGPDEGHDHAHHDHHA